MKKLFALLLALVVSAASADTTNNVLNSTNWTGVTNGSLPTSRMPGSSLLYDTATGTVNWSYSTATAAKTIAINNALSGSGVQVGGYNYTYDLRNMNGDDRQGSIDTMTVVTKMTSNTGATLLSNTNTHNTKFDWTTFSGTQNLNNPAYLTGVGNLSISFTSRDSGFWAGYFGPEVRNVGMSLNYTVDPCIGNPAYSPSCANYNTVYSSNNLVPNPTGYASSGSSINQSYAINQALSLSGANVMIHGFEWGYQANANGPYCASWFLICLDTRTPSVVTNVSITDNNNNSLYSISRTYTNSYNTTSYSYLFPNSRNLLTLGNFNFTAQTTTGSYVGDIWSKALYTPDPCTVNPLSSTTCPGYQQAYHDQQCSISALYAVDCAGYQQAYFNQQCSASALYNASCPGYATAYFNQQCSASALYDSTCPGYAQAYLTQQCNNDPLYSNQCTGYQAAYLTQQCNISQLYSTSCPNYQQAYFAQQCQLNGLYDRTCPNYGTAYASKNILSTPTTTTAPTSTVVISTESTSTVTSNPAAAAISDPVVSSAVSTPSTTSATSPTSVTSVISAPAAATSPAAVAATTPTPAPAPSAETKAEAKKTEGAVAKAAARGNAAAAAKEAATAAANASSMEAQVATQGLVVGLMGYVPGFSAYQNAIVPDTLANAVARQYHKPTVDNRNAQRRLTGASDARWQEMVDSQYKLGN